jgi:hypothetical protein
MSNIVQVRLAPTSGLPEDWIINTFTMSTTGQTEAIGDSIRDALYAFYQMIDGHMSTLITAAGHEVRIYDRSDLEPRSPWYTEELGTLTRGTGEGMPPEVALVMSIQGVRTSGVPLARTRGRIYFGPFTEGASVAARPNAALVSDLRTAGANLLAASDAAATWSWGVYSPTSSATRDVIGGWVDNEWDIIRSRTRKATGRSVYGSLT